MMACYKTRGGGNNKGYGALLTTLEKDSTRSSDSPLIIYIWYYDNSKRMVLALCIPDKASGNGDIKGKISEAGYG